MVQNSNTDDFNISNKIDILFRERSNLRENINQLSYQLYGTLFSFLSVAAGGLGISMSDVIENKSLRQALAFALSQIEFLLGLVAIALLCLISASSEHIKTIEDRINSIANEKLLFWETEIVPKYILCRKSLKRGTFFWVIFCIIISLMILYFLLIWESALLQNNIGFLIIIGIEALITVGFLITVAISEGIIYNYAKHLPLYRKRAKNN